MLSLLAKNNILTLNDFADLASFELIDDRNADYRDLQVNSLIADNSWFAGAVLAEENKEWRKLDFQNLMVKKTINNSIETSTTGAALGNPFNSVAWIANFLNIHGQQLKANELLMTGSTFATMFPNSCLLYTSPSPRD